MQGYAADMCSAPGLEEYIEAVSFLFYLETGRLISLAEVQKGVSDPETGEPVSYICDSPLT